MQQQQQQHWTTEKAVEYDERQWAAGALGIRLLTYQAAHLRFPIIRFFG